MFSKGNMFYVGAVLPPRAIAIGYHDAIDLSFYSLSHKVTTLAKRFKKSSPYFQIRSGQFQSMFSAYRTFAKVHFCGTYYK